MFELVLRKGCTQELAKESQIRSDNINHMEIDASGVRNIASSQEFQKCYNVNVQKATFYCFSAK